MASPNVGYREGPPPAHGGSQGWAHAPPSPGVLPQTGAWQTLAPGVSILGQGCHWFKAAQPWAEPSNRHEPVLDLQAPGRQSPRAPVCLTSPSYSPSRPEPSSATDAGPETRVQECVGPNRQIEVLSKGAETTPQQLEVTRGTRTDFLDPGEDSEALV